MGERWCPDCAQAEPLAEEVFARAPAAAQLIVVEVSRDGEPPCFLLSWSYDFSHLSVKSGKDQRVKSIFCVRSRIMSQVRFNHAGL